MLSHCGHTLTKQSRILDFCCGAGDMVREFRRAGYDTVGFEPFAGVAPDTDEFATWDWDWPDPHGDPARLPGWRGAKLPYPDGHFDFIYSIEVMEHVSDHASVLSELRRVTKPDGAQIHSFPGCWQLVDPHINVPFGGLIKNLAWYWIWDQLGWKNVHLVNLSSVERARRNLDYARVSLNYLPPQDLTRIGEKYFRLSRFIPELWEQDSPKPVKHPWLYTRTQKVIWFLADPIAKQ